MDKFLRDVDNLLREVLITIDKRVVCAHLLKGVYMNSTERKVRFTEIMSSIDLMGDHNSEDYDPKLPDGTKGLSDSNLKTAIMAQAIKNRDEEAFIGHMINALANTGFSTISDKARSGEEITDDDLSTATMAIHVAWAVGAFEPMAMMLGTYGKMLCDLNIEAPNDLTLIFRPNRPMIEGAKNEDPIALLDMTIEDMLERLAQKAQDDDE